MKKRIAGHYIWNRAERVDSKAMPDVVIESFDRWRKELSLRWDEMPKKRQDHLRYRITKQRNNMNESLVKLGYEPHYK